MDTPPKILTSQQPYYEPCPKLQCSCYTSKGLVKGGSRHKDWWHRQIPAEHKLAQTIFGHCIGGSFWRKRLVFAHVNAETHDSLSNLSQSIELLP